MWHRPQPAGWGFTSANVSPFLSANGTSEAKAVTGRGISASALCLSGLQHVHGQSFCVLTAWEGAGLARSKWVLC